MKRFTNVLIFGATALLASSVPAQTPFPNKSIRLIVPITADDPSDAIARAHAKGMVAALGQEVLVDNPPGANTGVGAAMVLNAAPDGYTLLFALAAGAGNPQCLVVPPSVPAKTLAEFAAHAKSTAQPLMRGSSNPDEDLLADQVTGALGFKLGRAPYKGGSQMLPDLLEGRLQAAVLPAGFAVPYVQSGK